MVFKVYQYRRRNRIDLSDGCIVKHCTFKTWPLTENHFDWTNYLFVLLFLNTIDFVHKCQEINKHMYFNFHVCVAQLPIFMLFFLDNIPKSRTILRFNDKIIYRLITSVLQVRMHPALYQHLSVLATVSRTDPVAFKLKNANISTFILTLLNSAIY